MERDLTYEKNNIGFDDHYREEDGGGIKLLMLFGTY